MKVSVTGMGYIGLPTAALIASRNFEVIGVDIDNTVVDKINSGKIHIVENNLDILVENVVKKGLLKASTNVQAADIFIIAVPTPIDSNMKPDLSFVQSATVEISKVLKKGDLIILESTSTVGTTENIIKWISNLRPDLIMPNPKDEESDSDINLAYCPERVLPGKILEELISNDRVIGGISSVCSKKAADFYKTFVTGECLITNSRTAEMCKLVENSYRDTNIAFANELSIISEKLGINVWELISLANHHPRVNILEPGPGVGGHCIAVDPYFIIDSCPDESIIISASRKVNNSKPDFVLNQIKNALVKTDKNISEINICCLGLAFKPNIDDLRESPALDIAIEISKMQFNNIYIVEPNIDSLPKVFDKAQSKLVSYDDAIDNSDVIVVLVHHDEFKLISSDRISSKIVIDTRGIYSNKNVSKFK